jgi:hypothetical protein
MLSGGFGRGIGGGGWMAQQPVIFGGVGQRLVPEGAPGADNHNNRQAADLAGMTIDPLSR